MVRDGLLKSTVFLKLIIEKVIPFQKNAMNLEYNFERYKEALEDFTPDKLQN